MQRSTETLRFFELLGRTNQPVWMSTQYGPGKSFAIVVELDDANPAVMPLIKPTPSLVMAKGSVLYAVWLLSETSHADDDRWMPQVAFDLAEHVGGTARPHMLIPGISVPGTGESPGSEGYARLIEVGDCEIYDPADLAKHVAVGNQR